MSVTTYTRPERVFTVYVRSDEEHDEEFLDEQVQFTSSQLPDDPAPLIQLLRGELATLNLWHAIACEYYSQGRIDQFLAVLSDENLDAFGEVFHDDKKGIVKAYVVVAAHWVREGSLRTDAAQRQELFLKAESYFYKAEVVDNTNERLWICKGTAFLAKGPKHYDTALLCFNSALDIDDTIIPALLGKGSILYQRGNYKDALYCYERALKLCPTLPPAGRMGLGLCYAALGALEPATKAFDRVLQLDPENVEALVALAVIDLNSAQTTDDTDGIRKGVTKLARAFNLNPGNANNLNHLSNHFFYAGDYGKARKLASAAYHTTMSRQIKAESLYNLARTHHAEGKYDQALKHYTESLKHWSTFTLPQFGVGQVLIYQKKLPEAVGAFEKLLKQHPDNIETQRVLGSLYLQLSCKVSNAEKRETYRTKAINYLRTSVVNLPRDVEAHVELAQLLENSKPKEAVNCLRRAERVLKSDEKEVPTCLYNNMGALYLVLGKLTEAEEYFFKTIRARDGSEHPLEKFSYADESTPVPLDRENTTVMYNLARVYEESMATVKARRLHTAILDEHPNYVDSSLRLAEIELNAGAPKKAEEWIQSAIGAQPENVNAWISYGNLLLAQETWRPAQKKFERVLEKCGSEGKNDPYSMTAIGNIINETAYKSKDHSRQRDKAYALYSKVLIKDPTNVFAATGIGSVLAGKGHVIEAKDVFLKAREATADVPDVWLNLAHCYTLLKQPAKAVQLYQQAQHKFFQGNNADIAMYIGRALAESEDWVGARSALQRAARLRPWDMMIRFDIALMRQEQAVRILKRQRPTVDLVRSAVTHLEKAAEVFTQLASMPARRLGFDPHKANVHASFCANSAAKAHSHVKVAEEAAAQDEARAEATKKKMEERAAERRAAEEKKKQELADAERERLQRAHELDQSLGALKEKWQSAAKEIEAAEEADKKKGGGKGKKVVVADLDSSSGESESDSGASGSKKGKKRDRAPEGGDAAGSHAEPEGEDGTPAKKRKRAGVIDDDSSKSEEEKKKDDTPAAEPAAPEAVIEDAVTHEEAYDFAGDLEDSDSD